MKLGKILGTTSTKEFQFKVDNNDFAIANAKKFDFVKSYHKIYDFVYGQIIELYKENNELIAKCSIMGYYKDNKLNQILTPIDNSVEVFQVQAKEVKDFFSFSKKGAYLGKLQPLSINIFLDLNKILTKHVAILAKSGSGKSYTVGVLIEEIVKYKIPILIIDPHGEYGSLKYANTEFSEVLKDYGLEPKSFYDKVTEYGDPKSIKNCEQLKIPSNLTINDLFMILPKLSQSQKSLIYSLYGVNSIENNLENVENGNEVNFDRDLNIDEFINEITISQSNSKWSIMHMLNNIRIYNIFHNGVDLSNLIKPGKISILNLKGYPSELQESITALVLSKLFAQRKLNQTIPFFCVVEEAHNFCPERNYKQAKSSSIIRTIASEGRKFGLSLCVVSQRPSRVDKNVLSQCSTQLIMKITNPNDLKAIINSVEGITSETYNEIKSLPVGYSLVANVFDSPIIVKVRPRLTKHGGVAQLNLTQSENKLDSFFNSFSQSLEYYKPRTTKNDLKLIYNSDFKNIIIPVLVIEFERNSSTNRLVVDLTTNLIVNDIDKYNISLIENKPTRDHFVNIVDLSKYNNRELIVINFILNSKVFNLAEIIYKILKETQSKKLNFSKEEISSMISKFTKDHLLVYDGYNFKISDDLDFVANPLNYANNYELKSGIVEFSNKLEIKYDKSDVITNLSKFLTIKKHYVAYILSFARTK